MRRMAFTLIELLVVVTIIAMLSAAAIGAYAWAQHTARIQKTRALIAKIDLVLADMQSDFAVRRLPADPPRLGSYPLLPPPAPGEGPVTPREQRQATVWNWKRDLYRMEAPDRWSDVTGPPLCLPPRQYTAQSHYYRLYQGAVARTDEATAKRWEQAELLYLVVTYHGRQVIDWHENEYADRDGDGLREVVDAWGLPLMFLRWPAGYPDELPAPESTVRGIEGLGPRPLVLSAGPDGLYDINRGVEAGGETYVYGIDFAGNLNPWTLDEHAPPRLIGEPVDATGPGGEKADGHLSHFDNITNRDR